MKKHDIFISYSRSDLAIVEPFVKDLESSTGVNCWIDWTGIESGSQFEETIIGAINSVDVVLFFLSEQSIMSQYVKMEINYAYNIGKKVVPLVIDGGVLRGWFLFKFGSTDYIDIRNSRQVDKLKQNISEWCGLDSSDGQHRPSPATRKTYQIGDIYDDGQIQGVVFEVDKSGEHGKIVHCNEAVLQWSKKSNCQKLCTFTEDGEANMQAIKFQDDWRMKFPAFNWCIELGERWYLPSIIELNTLVAVADKVNGSIQQLNGTTIRPANTMSTYWSSTQKTKGCAWTINSTSIEYMKIDLPIDLAVCVRAIGKF